MRNQTTQKKRAGHRLVRALDARHLNTLAGRLGERLSSLLPGAPAAFGLARVLNLLGVEIARQRRRLAAADAEVLQLERDLGEQRRCRDGAASEIRRQLVGMRRVVQSLYGAVGIEMLLGGVGEVPRGPKPLFELGSIAFRRFFDQPKGLPESRIAGAELDLVQVAYSLEAPLKALEDSLGRIWFLERNLSRARAFRNDALARTEALVKPTDSLLRALDELAGSDRDNNP